MAKFHVRLLKVPKKTQNISAAFWLDQLEPKSPLRTTNYALERRVPSCVGTRSLSTGLSAGVLQVTSGHHSCRHRTRDARQEEDAWDQSPKAEQETSPARPARRTAAGRTAPLPSHPFPTSPPHCHLAVPSFPALLSLHRELGVIPFMEVRNASLFFQIEATRHRREKNLTLNCKLGFKPHQPCCFSFLSLR